MAKKEDIASEEVVYLALQIFCESMVPKYGIEMVAGFFHEQELLKHFADTEENWKNLLDEFTKKEVK